MTKQKRKRWGRSPCLAVTEGNHGLKVVSSNPNPVWTEWTFCFTLICRKNCNVCLKKTEINEKEAVDDPF